MLRLARDHSLWLAFPMTSTDDLIRLLRRREEIIADHAWRDRDANDHLEALKQISGAITAWPESHPDPIDPRLRHFLANASFAKALAHLDGTSGK